MRIAVLVLDGVFDTGLAAVLDAFALADMLGARSTRFEVTRVGVRRRVKTGQGFVVPLDPAPARAPDLVLVPALGAKSPGALDEAIARTEARDACALLREWRAAGSRVAAACTATFLLAASSLLDGKPATTTWWLAAAFRERFPAVALREGEMIVASSDLVTAGAALAHLDLALWVIRRRSPALARTTARHLTFDRRLSQGAYVMPDHIAHSDELVERFEAWARRHLAGFTLGAAARAVGTSSRTLERRVHRVLGKSPLAFVQDLRVELAMAQLESSDRSVDEIAVRVGYRDGGTLRTLLREKTGRGVRELRRRG
ncbi:MAG TPA: helix-turn-helix domain-containing protein [Nannocystaceae bacterium]|nr:helix-turn-helix domain-containing protein [Nannocystaceae bacterium]